MRIPKSSTIQGRFMAYAFKAGFTVHPHRVGGVPRGVPGTYSLFDVRMGYYAHRNLTMDDMVRIIVDTLHTMEHNRSCVVKN